MGRRCGYEGVGVGLVEYEIDKNDVVGYMRPSLYLYGRCEDDVSEIRPTREVV